MFPDSVLAVLTADNPWLEGGDRNEWIKRHLPSVYIERRAEIKPGERAVLVIGPRQAGKSTLVWHTLSKIDRPCLYVNCEEVAIRDWATSPALFVDGLSGLLPPESVIFFEEIQSLSEAGLFLKGLVDRKTQYSFIATGSSSYELESKTRESLAGRADRCILLPLSFDELMDMKEDAPGLQPKRAQKTMGDLIVHGGYPAVVLGERKESLLTGLVESFVIRDASDRFRIRHTAAFRSLLELMASQIGNLCNFSQWAQVASVSSDTVRDYVSILEDAHVVKLVRPFAGGRRAEITSTPKVYFVDNGIRNRLFGGFGLTQKRPDSGQLVENYIFTELYKKMNPLLDSIRFWRTKSGAEVDFVIERNGVLTGLEVKAGKTYGRVSRSSRSFIQAYAPGHFWVAGDDEHPGFSISGTDVCFIRHTDLHRIIS